MRIRDHFRIGLCFCLIVGLAFGGIFGAYQAVEVLKEGMPVSRYHTIVIDAGHGGIDGGASGSNANHNEAERNLNLAYKIKEELVKAGAEVYMTRTDNSTSSTDDKITLLKEIKPDLCIAVHHDSNKSSSANGFSPYYSTPFSKNAAECISAQTQKLTSVYNKFNETRWHYYFMCRTTNCPVVLTENGFMSNSYDYGNIVNEEANVQKAKAITRGIVDYFKSIQ